jgi:site-specific recombinase XerC
VKQRLAALRMLFDWMVVGQVLPVNPADAVRGPKHSLRRGKTPVLQADEARALLDAIDTDSLLGLRDRALIGLMVYTFSRVGAAVSLSCPCCVRFESEYFEWAWFARNDWLGGGEGPLQPTQALSKPI